MRPSIPGIINSSELKSHLQIIPQQLGRKFSRIQDFLSWFHLLNRK